jgi:hypothetical protein
MLHGSARMALLSLSPGRLALFTLAALAAFPVVACVETSPSGVVVAPVASSSPSSEAGATAQSSDASSPDASPDPSAPVVADAGGAPARFRACSADADCVAVPRVGCCHNGWNEAVAASQKDAYRASFVCPEAHPICAMFIVRDTRVPQCDPAAHLCALRTVAK